MLKLAIGKILDRNDCMPEPVIITSLIQVFFIKKGAEGSWKLISNYIKKGWLIKEIQSALNSAPDMINPPPRLVKDHFNEESIKIILHATFTEDIDSLAKYLVEEQLINLPFYPKEKPESYADVWCCISKTVSQAVCDAVVKDQELFRLILLESGRVDHKLLIEVLSEVQKLNTKESNIEETAQEILSQVKNLSKDTNKKTFITSEASIRSMNLLAKQNEQLEQNLRILLDKETEQIWDQVLNEIKNYNFHEAVVKGQELNDLLDEKGEQLSNEIRGRAYLQLAHVALIEMTEFSELKNDYRKSWNLREKARTVFSDDISDENNLRLINFEAKLLSIEGQEVKALDLLGANTDPQTVTTKLLILIDQGECERAEKLICNLELNEKWCDFAVYVFAYVDSKKKANEALEWAKQNGDSLLEYRCRVAIARATLIRLMNAQRDTSLSPITISEMEIKLVEDLLAYLSPIVEKCRVSNKIETGLEADAVGFACIFYHLIGQYDKIKDYSKIFGSYRPVHLEYARACLRNDVEYDDTLAKKIREDHPYSFEAQFIALALEVQSGLSTDEIIDHTNCLVKLTILDDEKEKLARLVFQVATSSGKEVVNKLEKLIVLLVGPKHFLIKLLEAYNYYIHDKFEEFKNVLDGLNAQEDFLVEQFYAQLFLKQNKHADAAKILYKAGHRLSEPELLKQAASLAQKANPSDFNLAIKSLKEALIIVPNDIDANRMLAFVYVNLHGFSNAIDYFNKLQKLDPSEAFHGLNLAQCYSLANQPEAAIKVLDDLCIKSNVPLEVYLVHASILTNTGKPEQAFNALHRIRKVHWDDPAFIRSYMNVSYAANKEKFANEGFQQLWKLHENNKIPSDVLRPISKDDLIQLSQEAQEKRNYLHEQAIIGKLP